MTKEEVALFDYQLTKLESIASYMEVVHSKLPDEEDNVKNNVFGIRLELNSIIDELDNILQNNK